MFPCSARQPKFARQTKEERILCYNPERVCESRESIASRDRQTDRDREEILIVHPCYRDEKEKMKKLQAEMWRRTAEKDFCVIGGRHCFFENIIRVSFETGIGRLY
jgi:hypothetical protein